MTEGGMQGRVLGLDVGEARIGVAISDPERHLAVPLQIVSRTGASSGIEVLRQLVRDEEATDIVIGLPLSLSGARGPQAEAVSAFAETLRQDLALPVHLWDERLSTSEAVRLAGPGKSGRKGKARRNDASAHQDALAAAIILQAFLDAGRAESR